MLLIDDLIKFGYLETPEIIQAFKINKRLDFVLPQDKARAELDVALSIGYGQTISQPATVAFMLEKLRPRSGEKILDVGVGSGWTAALLASLVAPSGKVYGLERICQLVDFAIANVNKYNYITKGIVQIICADGYNGLPEFAPFDKILVSAVAEEIPEKLLQQMKVGGRMVLPIGKKFHTQSIFVIDKTGENEFFKKEYPGFIFVPLVKVR